MTRISAFYGSGAAKIQIANAEIIAGSLPRRALGLVREWTEAHRGELEANWKLAVSHEHLADRPTPMSDITYVTEVEPLEGHRIRATFTDGAVKEIDLGELLAAGGVFAPIYERREVFEQVAVNPESGTVEWPGEVDWTQGSSTAATNRPPATGSSATLFDLRSRALSSSSAAGVGRGLWAWRSA